MGPVFNSLGLSEWDPHRKKILNGQTIKAVIFYVPLLFGNQVELQSSVSADLSEKDAIFNYRRKYLPTQQVKRL